MDVQLYEKISISIPEEFKFADAQTRKSFFGATELNYAYMTDDNNAAFGVVRTGAALAAADVERRIAEYQQYYSRMVPGFTMGELRKNVRGGYNIAFMTYKSNAPTVDLYNILAIISEGEQEVLFLFACDMANAVKYMYQFVGVLDSIH